MEESLWECEGGCLGDHEGGQVGSVRGQCHQTEQTPNQTDQLRTGGLRNPTHQGHAQQHTHCVPEKSSIESSIVG